MPVECRRFEELDAAFWSYGVGAFRWTEVAVGDEVYRALAIVLPCHSGAPHVLYPDHAEINWAAPGPRRGWDGDEDRPTFTPSILCQSSGWHGYLTRGQLAEA